ncbi:MAG: PD-(D/E)XK motif protein [Firmicutes bacterium]|nr:PD-(D/E)XK motif protein [Bacillota bacterium]
MVEKIKNKIKQLKPKQDFLYLVEKINNKAGFFLLNDQIVFVEENFNNEKKDLTETTHLTLRTSVEITAVENAPSFKEGLYNFIVFKNQVDSEEFESFVNLCVLYVKDNTIGFSKFFFSIYNLFQKKEEKYKNLVGFWGELKFLLLADKLGADLSQNWHRLTNDKYDFVVRKFPFDIKTTITKDGFVKIKHSQIFNADNVYLVVCEAEISNAGETLMDLVSQIKTNKTFIRNVPFLLALEKEMTKVYKEDAEKEKFSLLGFKIFFTKDMPTIQNIPNNVIDVEYRYNYMMNKSISFKDFVKLLK